MILSYRIGSYVLLLFISFATGFLCGQRLDHKSTLQSAVVSYQKREKINGDVSKLSDIDLCIALGGLSDKCAFIVQRLDEATKSKLSGKNGQK
ncbi:MAG: hypothetical protein JSC188_000091 [Candidatus Tokpelaia sp. JSC188]|nr:MAG: hypothetical protein JSC188_000091 [Candidatus Tokpelaia sp. JSC188]